VNLFMIGHASASITTATCAAFTGAGPTGTTLVTNPRRSRFQAHPK
jgi:hypothetical protein